MKAQIASLLCTASGKIVVNIMKVQNQVSASQIYSEMLLFFWFSWGAMIVASTQLLLLHQLHLDKIHQDAYFSRTP